jgi:PII-like signaling protein
MTMLQEPAQRLTVIIGESDTVGHHPLYTEIVHRAHTAGLGGASVFRGIEGFGVSSRVHSTTILSLAEDLPVLVVIVDTARRIEEFLPVLEEIVVDGLVFIEDIRVVHRAGRAMG